MRCVLLGLAVAACGGDRGAPPAPVPAPPARYVGHAGPNELDPDASWMPLAGTTPAALEASLAATHDAKLTKLPALPDGAQVGTLFVAPGRPQAVWTLAPASGVSPAGSGAEGRRGPIDPQLGYAFRVDGDLDGDLTNDPPHALLPAGSDTWTGDVATDLGGEPSVFRVSLHAGELALIVTTKRRGEVDVGGRRVPFVLTGIMGRYGADKETVAIDVDGDGSADEDPTGEEAFAMRDRRVQLGSATYDFAVPPDGATLTLTPSAPGEHARPILKPGMPAPPFVASDLSGLHVDLRDLRGKVVALDFWAPWCAPCVRAIPELAALEAKDRNAGLVLVSIAMDDDLAEVRAFVDEHQMTWPQLVQSPSGPIAEAYRAVYMPDLFVIRRDGTLACAHCDRDTLAQTIDAALR